MRGNFSAGRSAGRLSRMDHPPNPQRDAYVARINRVIDHIAAHLAEPLDLHTLAAVAHFSPWHFHRVFQALRGETLADCVRRLRLEAAARRLLLKPPLPVLQVALDSGFASAEVFSRGFRAHFGASPTQWRRGAWRELGEQRQGELRKIHQVVHKNRQDGATPGGEDGQLRTTESTIETGTAMNVELRTLPPARLAYMRFTGPYGHPDISRTWQRFCAWAAQQDLFPADMLGIAQDDPEITPADKCRYDCCIAVDAAFTPRGEIGVQDFAGGRYACARFQGTGQEIHQAWMQMFATWLPASGYQPDDKPALELYEKNFESDAKTGMFTCLLCVPVRPI